MVKRMVLLACTSTCPLSIGRPGMRQSGLSFGINSVSLSSHNSVLRRFPMASGGQRCVGRLFGHRQSQDGAIHINVRSSQKIVFGAENHVGLNLEDLPLRENQLKISFTMLHEFDTECFGRLAGIQLVTDHGPMFRIALDDCAPSNFNGSNFPLPSHRAAQQYTIAIDFLEDTIQFSVNEGDLYGPVTLFGGRDWTPADVVKVSKSTLSWFACLSCTKMGRHHTLQVNDIILSQRSDQNPLKHLATEGAAVRSLVPGRSLFAAPHSGFRWRKGRLDDFQNWMAVTDLNRREPLVITADSPGFLYAFLWRWDFGILTNECTSGATLHGWELVDASAGNLMNLVAPLSPLPLYRRPIAICRHALEVAEYFGQWVVVGLAEDPQAQGSTGPLPDVELVDACTEHNIYDPGDQLRIVSDPLPHTVRLFGRTKPGTKFIPTRLPLPSSQGVTGWRYISSKDLASCL